MKPLDLPETLILPSQGGLGLNLREVWDYRYMAYFMVLRTLKSSYQQSVLGPLWIVINNFIGVIIYSAFFGLVAQLSTDGIPYPLFIFVGMMPWGLFSANTTGIAASMNNGMIKKVYFPRLIIPLISVGNYMVNFFFSALLLIFFMLFYQVTPTWHFISLPFFSLVSLMAGMGLGLIFAPLDVYSHDVRHILGYLMRFWFYATPVVYARDVLPDYLQNLAHLNPIIALIEGYRWALLGTPAPSMSSLVYSTIFALVVFYLGLIIFKRQETYLADLI